MGVFKNIAQRVVNIAWHALHDSKPKKRSFDSAQVSNLTSSWTTMPKPIDVDIRNGLRKLRARARHEAQNNDYVRRFLSLVKTNVVGAQGILLQPRIVDLDGTADTLANQSVENGWLNWGKKGTADVTGKLSWKMIQRLYIETLARDGEVLIRMVKGRKVNKFGFALQFLDVELLDVELTTTLRNGNTIQMGIEFDQWRKPVAYYLFSSSQTANTYNHAGRKYERIPANEIIHDFLPEWVWQSRGIPFVSAGLLRLNMLAGYEEAELVASRASAAKFAVYEKVDDETPPVSPGEQFEQQDNGQFVQDFDSGTIEVTPEGYKLNLIDPQHPNSAYKDFVKACLRGISSGLGVTYNSLANDLEGVNYSSLRQGALEERAVWMVLQDWMIESFCERVYQEWLGMSLTMQALLVMNKPLKLELIDKYEKVSWQARRWQWVDPQKELNAHQIAFNNKIRSPQSVIREMGNDPAEVLDEWQRWNEELKKRNLKMEPANMAGSSFNEDQNNANQETDSQNQD